MKKTIIIFLFALLAISVFAESSGKIVFLQLHLTRDSISLTELSVVDGRLKQLRAVNPSLGLYYEAVSDKGQVLTFGYMDDPLVRVYEYEEPLNSGQLQVKIVELEEADFTIRIKHDPLIKQLDFYNAIPAVSDEKKLDLEPLGSIPITLSDGDNNR